MAKNKMMATQVLRSAGGKTLYTIQTRDKTDRLNSEWTREGLGDLSANRFTSKAAAEKAIRGLKKLGDDWAKAEYRVVEMK